MFLSGVLDSWFWILCRIFSSLQNAEDSPEFRPPKQVLRPEHFAAAHACSVRNPNPACATCNAGLLESTLRMRAGSRWRWRWRWRWSTPQLWSAPLSKHHSPPPIGRHARGFDLCRVFSSWPLALLMQHPAAVPRLASVNRSSDCPPEASPTRPLSCPPLASSPTRSALQRRVVLGDGPVECDVAVLHPSTSCILEMPSFAQSSSRKGKPRVVISSMVKMTALRRLSDVPRHEIPKVSLYSASSHGQVRLTDTPHSRLESYSMVLSTASSTCRLRGRISWWTTPYRKLRSSTTCMSCSAYLNFEGRDTLS